MSGDEHNYQHSGFFHKGIANVICRFVFATSVFALGCIYTTKLGEEEQEKKHLELKSEEVMNKYDINRDGQLDSSELTVLLENYKIMRR